MPITLDPHVYDFAAQRLRDVRYATRAEGERDVRALAEVIQRAIEDWEMAQDNAVLIRDVLGRIVAPAQHAPAPRPDGPWDQNRDNTTGE